MSTEETKASTKYIDMAVACGATISGDPTGEEPVRVVFTPEAWKQFSAHIVVIAEDGEKYRQLNTPEIQHFLHGVEREALHQRQRWAATGDAGKTDADWFWLLGFLGGKALHAGTSAAILALHGQNTAEQDNKRLHHIITTAAACLNWHAARVGTYTDMRPGIAAPEEQP